MNLKKVFQQASALGVKLKRNRHDDFDMTLPGGTCTARKMSLKNVMIVLDTLTKDAKLTNDDH